MREEMRELYGSEYNERYSEENRFIEDNVTGVCSDTPEWFVASENDYGSARSGGAPRKRKAKELGAFFTFGTGVATVMVTVAVVLAVSLSLLFAEITSYTLKVGFNVENPDNVALTAYLTCESDVKTCPIDNFEKQSEVYFTFLRPDTDYLFEVKDADGKIYFSESYRTETYEPQISAPNWEFYGNQIDLFFEDATVIDKYDFYLDGVLRTDAVTPNQYICFTNIKPNTEYLLHVLDKADGTLAYFTVLNGGNYLEAEITVIGENEIELTFDQRLFNFEYPLEAYLDGQPTGQSVFKENNVVNLKGLQGDRVYEIALYDPVKDQWPYKINFSPEQGRIE